MKRIAILGSTGSIGKSTLEVIRQLPLEFKAVGLSTNSHIDVLYQQIKEFHPSFVCVNDANSARELQSRLKTNKVKLFTGEEGLRVMMRDKRIDKIVLAISGSAALLPLLAAIENGKDIALANKEALVMAGPIIMHKAKEKKVEIVPVDSEQSAIWQCLDGRDLKKVKNIYLTASGGPFIKATKLELMNVSIDKVLRHPRWKMGKKISVDSASLMNKGLEVLETMFLFNIPVDKIKVLIHPEAVVHSMVEFIDGVILAQLSLTDMRIPIQYAISYPKRLSNTVGSIDFSKIGEFHFEEPDTKKFPCLEMAYQAAREMGTLPAVFNAANEVSVEEFLKGELEFIYIPKVIEKVINRHRNIRKPNLGDIQEADTWARNQAYKVISNLKL